MPAAAQDAKIQRPSRRRPDECLQSVEGADPRPVNGLDPVADLEAGRRGRAARLDESDPRRQPGPEIPMLPTVCFWPKATSVEFSG